MKIDPRARLSELEHRIVRQLCETGREPVLDVLNFHVEPYDTEPELWRLTAAIERLLRLGILAFNKSVPGCTYGPVTQDETRELREFAAYVERRDGKWTWASNEVAGRWHRHAARLVLTDTAWETYGQY